MSEVVILPLLYSHFTKSLKLQSNRLRACCEAVRGGEVYECEVQG